MDRNGVFEKVVAICLDVFDNEDIVLQEDSTAADVEEWDSLSQLSIISDLEDEFGFNFTIDEASSKTIGELVDAVMRHIS